MESFTRSIIKPYDFSPALKVHPEQRIDMFLNESEKLIRESGYKLINNLPTIPPGVSDEEIDHFEGLNKITLPLEYRMLLRKAAYVAIDDGLSIWGLPHKGVSIGSPWLSDEHNPGCHYLVFGNYWTFADGDQLMIDLNEPSRPVVVYLHEYPAIEYFAPSFSMGLWRMVYR